MTQESLKITSKNLVKDILEKERKELLSKYSFANRQYSTIESSDIGETAEGMKQLEELENTIDVLWNSEKLLDSIITFLDLI